MSIESAVPEDSHSSRIDIEVSQNQLVEFFVDVGEHLIVLWPATLRGVDVVSSSRSEIALHFDVTTPWKMIWSFDQHCTTALRGLVSGFATKKPYFAARRCMPDLVIQFCSVHVRPSAQRVSVKWARQDEEIQPTGEEDQQRDVFPISYVWDIDTEFHRTLQRPTKITRQLNRWSLALVHDLSWL